jgi:hypothetical protein
MDQLKHDYLKNFLFRGNTKLFKMKFSVLCVLALSFAKAPALYYPPILNPVVGDVITAGSEFNVTWYVFRNFSDISFTDFFFRNTTIPEGTPLSDVANSTSEVRLAIYFESTPPFVYTVSDYPGCSIS